MLLFILLLVKINVVMQEKRYKKNMFGIFGFSDGKVIFTLLVEITIFYMKFITIHIK